MTVPFLDARFDECRTPRWNASTPVLERMVCGAPVLAGRTYCAACRTVLIAGVMDKDGQVKWSNPSAGARWRNRPVIGFRDTKALDPDDEVSTDDPENLFDSPDLGSPEVSTDEEDEPDGDRPLQVADLQDWGMAA